MFTKEMLEGLGEPIQAGKRYARVKNREFIGFYLTDHPDFNLESGEFLDIGEDKINALLDGQSTGGEIRLLKNGEIGIFKRPPMPTNGFKMQFNYDSETWVETATLEEQVDILRTQIINKTKELRNIEESGFSDPIVSKELEDLKARHMELSHSLANKQNEVL